MVSTPTPSLQVEIPGPGDYRGIWDQVMFRILNQLDKSIAGVTNVNTTGGATNLTDTQYQDNQTRQAILLVSGALGSDATLVVPPRSKLYTVINKTTGDFKVYLRSSDGTRMECPAQGSAGQLRIASDKSIARLGPYVDIVTGEITSSRYAFLSEQADEVARATAEEETLAKLDGSRAFTSAISGVAPTANDHLATKQYVDGVAGISEASFVTTGTASAYVVTSGLDLMLTDGLTISFRMHVTNDEGCTLNLDGKGAKPLRGFTGKRLLAGVGIQGTPYRARYIASSQEWLFLGYFDSPYNIPLGGFLDYVKAEAPNSYFAMPFGQAISRTTYAALWNLIGSQFGAGNGTTTFNLPDLRGRTVVGLDNMGGNVAGRVTNGKSGIDGTTIGAVGGAETGLIARNNLPSVLLGFHGAWVPDHYHFMFNGIKDTTAPNNGFDLTNSNFPCVEGRIGYSAGYTMAGRGNLPDRGLTGPSGGHTPSGTIDNLNAGVQAELANVQPSIILPKLLRVI